MKYSKKTKTHKMVISHKNILFEINELLTKEGCNKIKSDNIYVINIDQLEILLARKQKRNKHKTIDFAFTISINNTNKLLLIEAKCNIKNSNNLNKRDIEEKIRNSKMLLGQTPPIFQTTLIIFSAKIINQARNNIRRYFLNKKIVEVITVEKLQEIINY